LEQYPEGSADGPPPIYPPCRTDRFKRLACDIERESFPFPDSSFDGAVLSHVIEHVGNADRVLAEIHRTLKPGGLLYVETPGPKSMTMIRPAWLPRTAGDTINFYDDSTHVGTAYSAPRLRDALETAGFKVVSEGPFRQLGRAGAPVYLLLMAVGALPFLPAAARTFAYGAGLRNLVGWAISALAQKI
jgi:SAM-dependent methyltransferase